jgi:cobalamin biosynthesis protein CbiD
MGDRTARALSARLEELAAAAERSGAPAAAIARLLEAASVATMNAVALDLLSSREATQIWREVEERHPVVAELRDAA